MTATCGCHSATAFLASSSVGKSRVTNAPWFSVRLIRSTTQWLVGQDQDAVRGRCPRHHDETVMTLTPTVNK